MTLRRSVPASGIGAVWLAPRIGAGRPVLLFRCNVTASALARPLWRLRRYQSFPLFKRVERTGRINARRSSDEHDYLLKLGSAELSRDLLTLLS